jgi:membrane protein
VVVANTSSILYSYGPDRRAARWQWVGIGSVFATLTWFVASFLFSWYLTNFANYNATYGSLGAVVGLMIWLWISTAVVLHVRASMFDPHRISIRSRVTAVR